MRTLPFLFAVVFMLASCGPPPPEGCSGTGECACDVTGTLCACASGACTWRTSSEVGPRQLLQCAAGTSCNAQCDSLCAVQCGENGSCSVRTGEVADVDCPSGSTCSVTATGGGQVVCDGLQTNCTVTASFGTIVFCRGGATCNVQCIGQCGVQCLGGNCMAQCSDDLETEMVATVKSCASL